MASAGIVAPVAARAAGTAPPVALDAAFQPAEQSARLLKASDNKAMQGLRKVAVPLFTVEFVTADSVSGQTSGFAAAGRASASAFYKLTGVGETDFQAITDTLYADFLRELAASGLEVVPRETWSASPAFTKIAAGATASPIKGGSAITLAPTGMSIYGFGKVQTAGGGLLGGLSMLTAGFSGVGAAIDTAALINELGPAAVLEVQMKMHFVSLTNHNKGFFGRLGPTASVSGEVMPIVQSVTLNVQNAAGRSAVTLTNPLLLDAGALTVREEATTAGDVAGAVFAGLIRAAAGSSDSSSSSRYEAAADPVRYREVVGSGLGAVNRMLVARLRAER